MARGDQIGRQWGIIQTLVSSRRGKTAAELAEELECNGAKFYRQAAENVADKQIKQFLLDLSVMEEGHLKAFQQMRKELGDEEKKPTIYDPDNQAVLYLQAMADDHGYEGKITPAQPLTGNESTTEIIEIALNSEKESVVFYFGLKAMVSAKAGKDKVEAIILEELSHITSLLNQLKALN